MPTAYGALGLLAPIGADFTDEYRLAITQHAQVLGGAATYVPGTFSARPAATTVAPGTLYWASDQNVVYVAVGPGSTATAWNRTSGLTPSLPSGSVTAAYGQFVLGAPGSTVTLPAALGTGSVIAIASDNAASGTNQVTVACSGFNLFIGGGVNAAASFKLGSPAASVYLIDAISGGWRFIAGTQDTGWVPLSLASGVSALSPGYSPAARLRGDRVEFCGTMTGASPSTWATVPSGMAPNMPVNFQVGVTNTTAAQVSVSTAGAITGGGTANFLGLDGLGYRLI